MPTLHKQYTLTVTPEQFLEACSPTELYELHMLLSSPRYQSKLQESETLEIPARDEDGN